jgi:hypothetical protein
MRNAELRGRRSAGICEAQLPLRAERQRDRFLFDPK